ncbi:hypothetical protein A3A39_01065 [Candidatus Kaiserbacteria bacterium RIFCSPLOWO2_01_FULL_54_13]|uniref:DUF305 domain-containing protein n=1 Tax=Candidatus Kaiserbacteria bacterium RIFCSPLOWO2_01_FULL_54_13 TaxID=1798512 RepID=A0A1F6F264_9BACT|nr:MAG: hypothetical protein A3A39_01065 [Candidatus Kaiserbacteria bacterium RIFCSPLOWO2_01_FULL_54_13]
MENTNNNLIIVALLTLLVGLVIGLALGNRGVGAGMMGMGGMMRADMEMEDVMHGMMGELEDLSGDAFDRAFISEMIVHHEGAVEMAEAALKNAKHEEIKKMAEDIISAQTREIDQMKEWQRSWYAR